MPKSRDILLGDATVIPILYEDRAVLAIDKPAGWMLAPVSWAQTGRNLQRALESSLMGGDFWARSRNLKYLRFVHRLDAETTGILLLAKSPGALKALQQIFETRQVEKAYLAVVQGVPKQREWVCRLALGPKAVGSVEQKTVRPGSASGKPAETAFRVLQTAKGRTLLLASPRTGRTHQIRVHLAAAGHPVLGDALYGHEKGIRKRASATGTSPMTDPKNSLPGSPTPSPWPLALRAIGLSYRDPFTGKAIRIKAPFAEFSQAYGFEIEPKQLCVHFGGNCDRT